MNILIPTDFSDNSRNAIRYAVDYFAHIPVNFFLLHISIFNPQLKYSGQEEFTESQGSSVINSPNVALREEIKKCSSLTQNPEHIFFPIYEEALLVEAIRKHLMEKDIDYIVMGTKGASKRNRNELGSNTSEVIKKVKCPVLVIPEKASFAAVRNISFLTDYNCIYRNKVITKLSQILALKNAALRVLHIRSQNSELTAEQRDNKGFLHYFFKDTKHSFHYLENKNFEVGIQDFVETWEIDMIAIVAKNLNLINRLLFTPVTHTTNYQSEIPFLILHE